MNTPNQPAEKLEVLAKAIFKSSVNAANQLKYLMEGEENHDLKWIEVFYEFQLFFIQLTQRITFERFGQEKRVKIINNLLPYLTSVTTETLFNNRPKSFKDKITTEYYEMLNKSEIEYAQSKELFSKERSFLGTSSISILSRNVSNVISGSLNPEAIMRTTEVAIKSIKEIKLEDIIDEINR